MPASENEIGVFVNCPFDPQYQKTFDAIVFTIAACGFRVRSALEVEDSGEQRLTKIIDIIEQSKLSIHDLSRVTLDPATKLPRFNMPLELGITLGMKHLGRSSLRDHRLLVLDAKQFRYRASASDLAGVDIKVHSDDPAKAIACVRTFLANFSPRSLPTEDQFQVLYDLFEAQLPKVAAAAKQTVSKLTFTDRLRYIVAFINSQS